MRKTKAYEQYLAGRAFKQRIGLYDTVGRNRRFYCGEQWGEGQLDRALPKPVFNVVARVTDYLVGAVAGGRLSVTYSDESVGPQTSPSHRQQMQAGLDCLDRHLTYQWERCHMDRLTYRLLLDAALSGDGVLYCYRENTPEGAGDIKTVVWDGCELYAADMNTPDIQGQEYIILAGRESVGKLRRDAKALGLGAEAIARIRPDGEGLSQAADRSRVELEDEESAKTTVLLKFWKQDGVVWFEKATREVVLRRVETAQRLYPVAYFNWAPGFDCFHGTSPVSALIPNQRFINRAYGMVMKHMSDTAFSKVIYDKSRIPEWTNEVGEAIAAVGGDLGGAVQVVGTGQMQEGYMALIESAIAMTKEMAGANDTVLGSAKANNTSAILALQEASRISLQQVSAAYQQCIEDLAHIWADMLCASYGSHIQLSVLSDGGYGTELLDLELLRHGMLRARVEIGNLTQYSASGTQNALEKLLDGGHITLEQYLEQLPTGILPNRGRLIAQLQSAKEETHE